MSLQNSLDDRQSDTRSDDAAAMHAIDLIVAIPDAGQILGRDALAVIRDRDTNAVTVKRLNDADPFVLARIVDGVVYEVI